MKSRFCVCVCANKPRKEKAMATWFKYVSHTRADDPHLCSFSVCFTIIYYTYLCVLSRFIWPHRLVGVRNLDEEKCEPQASRTTTKINLIEHDFLLAADDEHRSDWTESMKFFDIGVSLRLLRSVIFRDKKRKRERGAIKCKQLMMEHLAFT